MSLCYEVNNVIYVEIIPNNLMIQPKLQLFSPQKNYENAKREKRLHMRYLSILRQPSTSWDMLFIMIFFRFALNLVGFKTKSEL